MLYPVINKLTIISFASTEFKALLWPKIISLKTAGKNDYLHNLLSTRRGILASNSGTKEQGKTIILRIGISRQIENIKESDSIFLPELLAYDL